MNLTGRGKVVLAIVTNVGLLGLAEVAARAFLPAATKAKETPVEFVGNDPNGRFPTQWDEDLFWSIPPHSEIPDIHPTEIVNAHGLRGPEFTNKKPEGVRRVVFLGDSNTFGMGADRYDNYPHRLGRWLSYSAGKRWEVINAAIPGYSAFQMLQMLRTRAKDYAPDVVVVYPGAWNDYTPAIQYDDATAHEVIEAAKAARTGLSVKRLRVYELLAQSMKHTASAASSDGKAQKYRKLWSDAAQRPDGPRLSQQKFREVLTAIARESKALGAKVIFIVPPAPAATRAKFVEGNIYAQIVGEVGSKEADKCVDARTVLTLPEEYDSKLFCDHIHPSGLGHSILAKIVGEALLDLGLDGMPTESPQAFVAPPTSLIPYLSKGTFEAGDPMAPVSVEEAGKMGGEQLISLPAPHRVVVQGVPIPVGASLQLELLFFTRKDFSKEQMELDPKDPVQVGPVDFDLSVQEGAGAPKVVLHESRTASNKDKWSPIWKIEVDLSEYSGKSVTLIFECKGKATRAVWGALQFDAFH
jgi:lysophospholipase L1-like esterase